MNLLDSIKQIKTIPEENILINESMKKHTSFKIGGPAEIFIKITKIEQLQEILLFSKKNNISIHVVGNGTNILVKDKGIKGIVIKIDLTNIEIEMNEKKAQIDVQSGVLLGYLSQKLLKEEISGFEELSGIPGTIGGAITMNAGAYGKEIKDILISVTAIDYDGNIKEFQKDELEFEYRKSIFQKENYIILSAKLELEKGNKKNIKQKMQEYIISRKEKQPIEYSNAGSTFKRGEDFITAKLIDEAGLKGYNIGDAKVSEKHAGFIINEGNATAEDVIKLANHVKKVIKEKFAKDLELEIKIIGE